MAECCVVGVYRTLAEAQSAVHILHRSDFPRGRTTLIATHDGPSPQLAEIAALGDDSGRDAAIGAGIGGAMGTLAGVSLAAASGTAMLLLTGPIAVGGLASALVGAFVGSLLGWGIHSAQISHYEKLLASGKTLVVAEGDPLEVAHAERVLRETDPAELHRHVRDGSEAKEIVATT